MRLLLFCLLVLSAPDVFGQQQLVTDSSTSVAIRKDPRLDILSARQAEINRKAVMMSITRVRGYRIQIINTQNRDEANNVKVEMLRRFPEHKTYLLYRAPNYSVRLGNFLSQRDAEPIRKMIGALYPNRGIYLVSDMVEYRHKEDDDPSDLD